MIDREVRNQGAALGVGVGHRHRPCERPDTPGLSSGGSGNKLRFFRRFPPVKTRFFDMASPR